MKKGVKNSGMKRLYWRRAGLTAVLTGLFCVLGTLGAGRAAAAGVNLDENEEVQWVMGDLSALKTAAHLYYSDYCGENGQKRNAPSLSEILRYFDDGSLPPNAASLYAVRGGVAGWYVGYRAAGLKDETYRLLHENANTLELVCDDLRSPWKRGSAYIWSLALPLGAYGAGAPKATIRGSDAVGTAAVMIGTAILLNIIDDHRHGGYYYHYPRGPWYWKSALAYRHAYRDRFFGRSHRFLPPPSPHRRPVFRPDADKKYPRPRPAEIAPPHRSGPRGNPRRDPRQNRNIRRPGPEGPRPERHRGPARPGGHEIGRRPESPSPRREAPRREHEQFRREDRREDGRGRPRR
jgi:hypothetical protein